jgi:hypothetical protein
LVVSLKELSGWLGRWMRRRVTGDNIHAKPTLGEISFPRLVLSEYG